MAAVRPPHHDAAQGGARLLVNARFRDPMAPAGIHGEALPDAMAVEGGRIVAMGRAAELAPFADRGFVRTDMGGATVLPGFIDCHSHLLLTGIMDLGMDLSAAENLGDVLDMVADAVRNAPFGAMVYGFRLEELDLAERRMPTKAELDAVAPGRAVLLMHATCHRCIMNTPALRQLAVPRGLPGADTEGGRGTAPFTGVVRDPGILTWVFPAILRSMDRAHLDAAALVAARSALRVGITTVHSMEGGELTPGGSPVLLDNATRLPLRVVCWNQSMDLAEVEQLALPRVGGCICADGELDARTAALFEPYSDDPGNDGTLLYSQQEMDDFVLTAHARGLQVAVHCESERAIDQVLRAMERAQRLEPRGDCRHRIEHFELPTWDQIDRMARAGVVASMQPAFVESYFGDDRMAHLASLFGPHRMRRLHPYRAILDAGVRVCGGSDSPVTNYTPLRGMAAAVHHPFAEQSVSMAEALRMFTTEAAFSAFEEADKGRLLPGMLADLVMLGQDPLDGRDGPTEMASVADIPVLGTWVDGQPVTPEP
ncbi:amidohydrolase [Nitratidesulfovibrio liaohensis]|uniref:Amidohydrolase n=1 Tax=Nitratidesulfovibrio liaohensis TaxID=2604158 RepID=A0ABY9R379_9BACT|nr:amidohydrolase [Nitratidesulfovibrio liaohensis]WMW66215.1 amidohydrolase [Nitratidesulfovibrio liaohensis]